jgi:hypothetical protein
LPLGSYVAGGCYIWNRYTTRRRASIVGARADTLWNFI